MDYLVRRLEGLGHAGRVAQIHGGMNWPERERQVERFRCPGGARYLVATDAAGEGINLQFCALMANYDIPWNPARLEQRMGRIHRYGQTRDVRIANLVATSTREGRVLQVLLEKLEAVRRELDSDKVFDVIGRLFENASLRDYMIETLTREGEGNAVARIGETLSGARVLGVKAAEERAYGPTGDVAARLDGLRTDMRRERYLQLLPGYVRRFVEKSVSLLDLDIRGDLDGYFSLAPRRAGALDGLLPVLADYSPEARKRLCVRRVEPGADCIWVHPGEPVFDALTAQVTDRFAHDAMRGGILHRSKGRTRPICFISPSLRRKSRPPPHRTAKPPSPPMRPGRYWNIVCWPCARRRRANPRRAWWNRCFCCTAAAMSRPELFHWPAGASRAARRGGELSGWTGASPACRRAPGGAASRIAGAPPPG